MQGRVGYVEQDGKHLFLRDLVVLKVMDLDKVILRVFNKNGTHNWDV